MTTEHEHNAAAISPDEFDLALKKLGYGGPSDVIAPRVAVAVSGGGDSMALAFLMQEWVNGHDGEMIAFTVDHGLRPESRAEAEEVQRIFSERGIDHEILGWRGEKPATHIQERAREARYALLLDACRERGCTILATAHNLEDQAETFWMRLAHGSGLDGLAGIAGSRQAGGISIVRPVLHFSRARLRATCGHYRAGWIEDPSNSNEKYLRVKLRAFETMLAGEGFTPQRLAVTLQKLEDARDALQQTAAIAMRACLTLHPEGYAELDLAPWLDFPRDIQRRILTEALQRVAPQAYPPAFEALEAARHEIFEANVLHPFKGRTLAGCEILPHGNRILFIREAAAVEGRVAAADGRVWDGRFEASGNFSNGAEIGALGDRGLQELRKNDALENALKALPFKARRVLPALWDSDDRLLAVPLLGYYSPACPEALRGSRMIFTKSA